MANILITGSRSIKDIDKVFDVLDKEVKNGDVIIQGGASGIDSIAFSWATQNGICMTTVKPIFPSKKEYYLHRNAEMIGMCDRVIAFWDGKSRGTQFTFKYARHRMIDVKVIRMT